MARRKPKSKIALPSINRQWKALLKTVPMIDIPINLISCMTIRLLDESEIFIDVDEMFQEEYENAFILTFVNREINKVKNQIKDIDYILNVEETANLVIPQTQHLLRDLL